jgi:uncharacterized protein (DUF1330 family)
MKTNHKFALAMAAGALIGIGGVTAIHAQQMKTPPGYIFAEIEVTDAAEVQKYGEKVPETLAPFNHHYVVRGGKSQPLEGDAPKSLVVIAFDSVAKAREWYDSPAYADIRGIRQRATKSRVFIAEGVAPQ